MTRPPARRRTSSIGYAAGAPNLLGTGYHLRPPVAGFIHLAVVLDAFSRKIVGRTMANHLRAKLALDALDMAIGRSAPGPTAREAGRGGNGGNDGRVR